MTAKSPGGEGEWIDPDDAPELTEEFFERAEYRKNGVLIRRGRPPIPYPKQAVSLRLSQEVLDYYRALGAGWQTRLNADLEQIVARSEPAK